MRSITKPGEHGRRSGPAIVHRDRQRSQRSKRSVATPDLSPLGEGCGEALPSLRGIRQNYRVETNGERLYRLCLALAERGLADKRLWQQAGKSAPVFVRMAIEQIIADSGGECLDNQIEYCCEIRDDLGMGYWPDRELGNGRLMAAFELSACGYLKIGAAIDALEGDERYLGGAFYVLLCRSLYRWLRIYDHTDAEFYNEQLQEWMEQDDPENREAYEFPPVDAAIPDPVKTVNTWKTPEVRMLLRRHLCGPRSAWISNLLKLHRLSRLKRDVMRFDGEFDDPPVPSLLIVFRENDAIQACFDHESERYNETTNEPSCAVCFRPDLREEFDRALRTMSIFFRINAELANLIQLVNEREEKDAGHCEHRTEPSLLAA